ncbi:MAG: hypothetical protein GY832_46465 [Chloroflexi bacterium]|nr:hypothetical protein [Chloroflexota bacterium]
MPLCETFFAAQVKAFDMVFDQVFFVVEKAVHCALLGLPALMAVRVRLLTVTGQDVMPDFNKALTLDVSYYQREAAKMLNSLAGLMRHDVNNMDLEVAFQNLGLSEFGPINLLTELIQPDPPNEPAPEWVQPDDDDDDGPPGLIDVPAEELAAPPATGATAMDVPSTSGFNAPWGPWHDTNYAHWLRMPSPFSLRQLASIHQIEMTNTLIVASRWDDKLVPM